MAYRHTTTIRLKKSFLSASLCVLVILFSLGISAGAETSIRANSIDKAESLETHTIGRQQTVPDKANGQNSNASIQGTNTSLWKSFFSLLIVLALIVLSALLFRWFSLKGQRHFKHSGIEIIARNNISPKQSLCLIKLGERLVLIGLSPNHMASLHTIEDAEEIGQIMGQIGQSGAKSITNTFGRMFRRETENYGHRETSDGEFGFTVDQDQQWSRAKGELSTLLNKVKGLTRLHFKS